MNAQRIPRPASESNGLLYLAAMLGIAAGALAAASLASACEGDESTPEHFARAEELLSEGADSRAVFHLRRHLEAAPDDQFARSLLARTYFHLGLVQASLQEVHLVLARNADDRAGLRVLAEIQEARGLHADAAATLERLVVEDADDDPALDMLRGKALLGAGRPVEAVAAFERALPWSDSDPELLNLYGLAALRADTKDMLVSARAALLRAVELSPASAAIRNNLGFVHEKLGELEEAFVQYSEAEGLSGSAPRYARNRERVEKALGSRS